MYIWVTGVIMLGITMFFVALFLLFLGGNSPIRFFFVTALLMFPGALIFKALLLRYGRHLARAEPDILKEMLVDLLDAEEILS